MREGKNNLHVMPSFYEFCTKISEIENGHFRPFNKLESVHSVVVQ
jgi:hypothetical protein